MSLAEYFEQVKGTGVLATANDKGQVDAAIYSRPHVIDSETVAFNFRKIPYPGDLAVFDPVYLDL